MSGAAFVDDVIRERAGKAEPVEPGGGVRLEVVEVGGGKGWRW